MKKSLLNLGTACAMGLTAHAAVVSNIIVDFTGFTAAVPCADDGNGEIVEFEGNAHIVITSTEDNDGGIHLKIHTNAQGLTGEGATTGDSYVGNGVNQERLNVMAGETYSLVNTLHVIGKGSGANLTLHETIHVTINANGEVTAEHDSTSVECN